MLQFGFLVSTVLHHTSSFQTLNTCIHQLQASVTFSSPPVYCYQRNLFHSLSQANNNSVVTLCPPLLHAMSPVVSLCDSDLVTGWSFAEKTFVKQSMMLCAFEILLKIGRFEGGGKSYRRFGG